VALRPSDCLNSENERCRAFWLDYIVNAKKLCKQLASNPMKISFLPIHPSNPFKSGYKSGYKFIFAVHPPCSMYIQFQYQNQTFQADLDQPLDLSILLRAGFDQVNCFWAPPVEYEPVRAGDFVGSTALGGPVNFFNIKVNPHGNGTHTECVGHIAKTPYVLGDCLRTYHFYAKLVSIYPQKLENGDRVILRDQLEAFLQPGEAQALVLRTLPNDTLKQRTQYSGSNPPYLHHAAAEYLVECGIEHLLLDLPSVDREEDGGQLLAHKAFWQYPAATRAHSTITELIFVPNEVHDGYYLLNIQIAAFDLDASPSKPVLYALQPYSTPL
jgi:kynurenine formamidase